MKRREVEKVRMRAIKSLCTYSEPSARVLIRATELRVICEMALKHLASKEAGDQMRLGL